MVATHWKCWSFVILWKHQELPAYSKGNPRQNPHSPQMTQTKPRCMAIWPNICQMEGTSEEKLSHSTQQSLYKEQLQGMPLKKQDIVRVYSDVFTRIGKFPGPPYKFQLKPNVKLARHAPRQVPIHLQEVFHKEIRNLEWLGILEPVKEVTEWVNSFAIVEKKVPADSNTEDYYTQKKLWICLDPRDLNEALEREPYYTRSIEEIPGKFHEWLDFL